MAVPFSILFMIVLPLAFLIFAWASIGTPKILKRTAMLAIIVPIFHILLFLLSPIPNSFFTMFLKSFIKVIIVCAIPFLCVFFNARRFDKSLSFKRALMFWLPE